MANLKEDEKRFIVQQFAMFETPQDIVALVNEHYGKLVSRQQVHKYNPKYYSIREDLKKLFDETRDKFLTEVEDIPIANKAYRLRELNRIYKNLKSAKMENVVESKATLEQAAKESGDVFTNKQKVEQNGTVQTVAMTLDEWKQRADERTAQAQAAAEKFEE